MTSTIFAVLAVLAFVFGFPAAEYAVHGWHPAFWPAGVSMPGTWFSAMRNSYGLDSLRAYRLLAMGQTASFGSLGLPVLGFIVIGPLAALMTCLWPRVAADPRGGKPPFRRPRDLVLMSLMVLALAGIAAKASYSTPERLVSFEQPVVLPLTYADGYRENFVLARDGAVALMDRPTAGLLRLKVWNLSRGYGFADAFEETVRPSSRS